MSFGEFEVLPDHQYREPNTEYVERIVYREPVQPVEPKSVFPPVSNKPDF